MYNPIKIVALFVLPIMMIGITFGQTEGKIKGLSFVGSSNPISENDVVPITAMNANWVTLMPYGFIGADGKVTFNSKWQWWGEKEEGVSKTIELCQASNLKIMLKPQIWIRNGYTGDFKCEREADWKIFEKSYRIFIETFVAIAVAYDVEMFCIGTEWREFVAARPVFWSQLIVDVKKYYKGEITYAANWDDYDAVPFWDDLNYIGVNGYFPISFSEDPTLNELMKGWELHEKTLSSFSKKKDREIIFTEIGYRSMLGATIKPWEHNTRKKYSAEIQDFAYQALFNVLWDKAWFKGVFIWKWYHNHEKQGGDGDVDFTPQNKLAAKTIQRYWLN